MFVRHASRLLPFIMLLVLFALAAQPLTTYARPPQPRAAGSGARGPSVSGQQPERYIIQLQDVPLASYRGERPGFAATAPAALNDRKLNLDRPQIRNYHAFLAQQQDALQRTISRDLGRDLAVQRRYTVVYNGVVASLTADEAARIATLPDVLSVTRDEVNTLQSDVGPSWIGASRIWDGSATNMFVATLLGVHTSPPSGSASAASALLWFDPASSTLSYRVAVPSSLTATAVHLHSGSRDSTGAVIAQLQGGPSMYTGSLVLNTAQVTELQREGLYLDVHTSAMPTGELRGQVTGAKGEGVVVGVFDTGINFDHPSFASRGGDGYVHRNPRGPGNYLGFCNPSHPQYRPTYACTDKLIGAWSYADTLNNPQDDSGHGSHTASTAAGNVITSTLINGVSTGGMQGVAPHATLIAYDVCDQSGACYDSAMVAALEQAVIDQVDVINFSISGPATDPWTSPLAKAMLGTHDAGIFLAVAAGNSGPGSGTVGQPGNAPWVMSVGASSHDRVFQNQLLAIAGGSTLPSAPFSGRSFTPGLDTTRIVYAGNYPNPNALAGENPALCGAAYPPGTFNGAIVVCDRGIYDRVAKANNVQAGGAAGFILVNTSATPDDLRWDTYSIPGIHLSLSEGSRLKAWLASGADHRARITGTTKGTNSQAADILAGFSSRGPTAFVPNVQKPNVVAPGVDILAAGPSLPTRGAYYVDSGTSMAAPHVAGAAALLTQVQPAWSAQEIVSALMLTADPARVQRDSVGTASGTHDRGSGLIDVARAAQAGFVLDAATPAFTAANPALGGLPETLNLPNLTQSACLARCSWTRTVSSTLAIPMTWTATTTSDGIGIIVTPATFTLPAYGQQVVTITADVSSFPTRAWRTGGVVLTAAQPSIPVARLPLLVRPMPAELARVYIDTHQNAGAQQFSATAPLTITALTVKSVGVVKATSTVATLSQDTQSASPFDALNDGVRVVSLQVPAGAAHLVADLTQTSARNLNLFVTRDSNADGIPQASEVVAQQTSTAALERIDVINPLPGTYHILAQNVSASQSGGDSLTLGSAVLPTQPNTALSMTKPGTIAANTPFTTDLFWNIPTMQPGERWYGMLLAGTDSYNPSNLGSVVVTLVRAANVTTTAGPRSVKAGVQSTLTYTITIPANATATDMTYTLTDTLPAGTTYVAGSATGGATMSGSTLRWQGILRNKTTVPAYVMTTSDTDPGCAAHGYYDGGKLGFGISSVEGDEGVWNSATTGTPFWFYGKAHPGLHISSNGFIRGRNAETINAGSWNTTLPDAGIPNNLMAAFWDDLVVVRVPDTSTGADNGRGVRVGLLDGTGPTSRLVVEYDQVQTWWDSTSRYTFEVVVRRVPSQVAGAYEVVYAYQTMSGGVNSATVGLENDTGTAGAQYSYNGSGQAVRNGLILCYEYVAPDPVVITYQVKTSTTPSAGTSYSNRVQYTTNSRGMTPQTVNATITVVP